MVFDPCSAFAENLNLKVQESQNDKKKQQNTLPASDDARRPPLLTPETARIISPKNDFTKLPDKIINKCIALLCTGNTLFLSHLYLRTGSTCEQLLEEAFINTWGQVQVVSHHENPLSIENRIQFTHKWLSKSCKPSLINGLHTPLSTCHKFTIE